MVSLEDGKVLVGAAREAVKAHFDGNVISLDGFDENSGVFVTIHYFKDHRLKGCIGFPEPVFPLGKGLVDAAVSAAFHDPRFESLKVEELDEVIFEVSVLTNPEELKVKDSNDYLDKIKIGRDGLIIEQGSYRGLLLPIVAADYGWDVKTFLEETCQKAGLVPNAWLDLDKTKVFRFSAQLFVEKEPNGIVVEQKDF